MVNTKNIAAYDHLQYNSNNELNDSTVVFQLQLILQGHSLFQGHSEIFSFRIYKIALCNSV